MGKAVEFDVSIEETELDREWLKQPKMYAEWALKSANARKHVDSAKNQLELIKADLYKSIVNAPELYGLTKTTEASVQHAIVASKEYQDAMSDLIEAKHKLAVGDAAVASLDQRKRALEKLVDLFLADYFSTPRASRDNKDVVDEMTKQSVRRRRRRKVS